MRTYAALALAATALAAPQGVATGIAPSAPPPPGCKTSYPGQFQITVVNVTSTPKKVKRDPLEITLAGGVLTDAKGRIGAIVANYQFQFDGPPQAGSIYTGGFSVCGNGSLALGGSAIFYQCLSGGFYNLYDRSWAPQCSPIYIQVMGASPAAASQAPDGQPGVTTQVSQITDGQVQATPVTQIGDGQIQGPKPMPVTQIGDGQIQGSAVSQISDGQIQAKPTAPKPLSQISDGQVQAPTGKPVAQISDGQIQATPMPMPAPKPVSQITDGQVQAPTGKPVSQISDGQIQAKPSSTGSPVAQITDGQIQVSSTKAAAATPVSSAPAQQTVNAAPAFKAEAGALVAGVAAVLALL